MSQILSPPQRRPDLIGQCESCKTIAIFGEEEQWIYNEMERVPSGWLGTYQTVKARHVVANCATEWCKKHGLRVYLWTRESGKGAELVRLGDAYQMACQPEEKE